MFTLTFLSSFVSKELSEILFSPIFSRPNLICKKDNVGEFRCIYNKINPSFDYNYVDYGAIAFKKIVFKNVKKFVFDLSEIQQNLTINSNSYYVEINKPYIEIGTPNSLKKATNYLRK